MTVRLCKIALVLAVGFFLVLVVLNNAIFDYESNYRFVQHVLAMDTLFSGETQTWRAWRDPSPADGSYWLYHTSYILIIVWEAIAAILCFAGVSRLWRARSSAADFNRAKSLATAGLTVSLLQWFFAFLTVGGEWLLMWQSPTWNGQNAAFRLFACLGLILLFLTQKDEDPSPPPQSHV